MGTTAEKYRLTWNDFQSNVAAAFKDLRFDDDFYDVTLACNARNSSLGSKGPPAEQPDRNRDEDEDEDMSAAAEHRSLRAHKVILSACSPYFRNLLKDLRRTASPDRPPVIYLRGVSFHDLSALLDFMYFGEVNVPQDQLGDFLNLAEEFQVKGLTQTKRANKGAERGPEAPLPPPHRPPGGRSARATKRVKSEGQVRASEPLSRKARLDPDRRSSTDDEDFEEDFHLEVDCPISISRDPSPNGSIAVADEAFFAIDASQGCKAEFLRNNCRPSTTKNEQWVCAICGAEMAYRKSIFRHIEASHMASDPIFCRDCGKMFKNKNSYTTHHINYHKKVSRASIAANLT